MNRYFLLLFSFFYLTTALAEETNTNDSPTVLVIDKDNLSSDKIISDILSLQNSLIVSPLDIPEPFTQTGFLLVPMTPEYLTSLLEKKEGQIICIYLEEKLLGYIILTVATEFEELYQDPLTGQFETPLSLVDVHQWLLDSKVGYIEQIAVRPDCSRMGIGSQLIRKSKTIKPHGLISDVFVYPVKNNPSLSFFSNQGFIPSGILYQYPGANANFPYEHRTQVFFWYGD